MDDRGDGGDGSTLSLVKDKQKGLEFTCAASSKGRLTEGVFVARDVEALDYLYRRAAYRSQATENRNAALLDLHNQPSSTAEWDL